MSRFVLSAQARLDLLNIYNYLADRNLDAAERLRERLHDVMRKLAAVPGMGRERPELGEGLRGFPVEKYLVVYSEARYGVDVARVLHGMRDIERVFKERRP